MLKQGESIRVSLFMANGIYLRLRTTGQRRRCAYCATGKCSIGNMMAALLAGAVTALASVKSVCMRRNVRKNQNFKHCTQCTCNTEFHKFSSAVIVLPRFYYVLPGAEVKK